MISVIPVQGSILTNCYLYADDATRHAFLIDPGFEPERIVDAVRKNHIVVEKILITHGHFDHISAAQAVAKNLGVPICASTRSQKYFESATYNLSKFFEAGALKIPEDAVTYLADGTTVALTDGALSLRLVPTPGHTEDGTMYVAEEVFATVVKNADGTENSVDRKNADGTEKSVAAKNDASRVAFVGDTIFRASYGATRFPGGDEATLLASIRTQILTLPDDTVLLSGHSEPTTVGEEKGQPWYR